MISFVLILDFGTYKMLKVGFITSVLLVFLSFLGMPKPGSQLDRFWLVYLQWASEHPVYECRVSPEIQVVHSTFHLWQIKKESGALDSILKITADFPISHEVYVSWDDRGRKRIYFPEIDRAILFCLDRNMASDLEADSFGVLDFFGDLKLIKKFLIFEELVETDEGIIFEMILDAEKMRGADLLSKRTEVRAARFIFTLKKSGELVRMSRQFDEGDLEVLYFDYISFSADEVYARFSKVKKCRSRNLMPDLTYTDALEEIKRVRQHSEAL